MPPLPGGHFLVDYLFKIGPVKGEEPLDGPALLAWERLLGIEWTPHQAELLVRLSREYLGEMQRATKRDAPPPWEKFEAPWRWVQKQRGERRLDTFFK